MHTTCSTARTRPSTKRHSRCSGTSRERPCLCCRKEHQLPPVIDLTDDDAPQDAGADERNEAIDAPPNADGAAVVSSSGSDPRMPTQRPPLPRATAPPCGLRANRWRCRAPAASGHPRRGTEGQGQEIDDARIAKIAEPLNGRSRAKARTAKSDSASSSSILCLMTTRVTTTRTRTSGPPTRTTNPATRMSMTKTTAAGGGSKQSA